MLEGRFRHGGSMLTGVDDEARVALAPGKFLFSPVSDTALSDMDTPMMKSRNILHGLGRGKRLLLH